MSSMPKSKPMKREHLWSLRLGYSSQQAEPIANLGIEQFLKKSLAFSDTPEVPPTIKHTPKTLAELKAFRDMKRNSTDKKAINQDFVRFGLDLIS